MCNVILGFIISFFQQKKLQNLKFDSKAFRRYMVYVFEKPEMNESNNNLSCLINNQAFLKANF